MTDVILTRPKYEHSEYAEILLKHGYSVKNVPFIRISSNDAAIDSMTGYLEAILSGTESKIDLVIFTSKNAAEITLGNCKKELFSVSPKIVTIGPATSKVVRKYNFSVFYESEGNSGASLMIELSNFCELNGKNVLLPCSKLSDDNLSLGLSKHNCHVVRFNIYEPVNRTVLPDELMEVAEARLVCFFSPSAVVSAVEQLGQTVLDKDVLAIGPTTYEQLQFHKFKMPNMTETISPESFADRVTELLDAQTP